MLRKLVVFLLLENSFSKYLNKYAYANSADPDQTAPKEQFDLHLHCLQFNQIISDTS